MCFNDCVRPAMHSEETLKMLSENTGRWNEDGHFMKLTKLIFLFQNRVEFKTISKELFDAIVKSLEPMYFQALLKDFVTALPAYKNSSLVTSLLKYRIDWLKEKLKSKPVFSWRMPEAEFPHHKVVENFLRSDKEKMIYTGVFDYNDTAKDFVDTYDHCNQKNFSMDMEYCGRGPYGKVKLTKTKRYFTELVDKYNRYVSDYKELLKLYFNK